MRRIAEMEKEGYGELYETPLFDEVTGRPLNDKARKLVGEQPTGESSGAVRRSATGLGSSSMMMGGMTEAEMAFSGATGGAFGGGY